MSTSLPFTGERFVPECSGEISYEHWHRYALVLELCRQRSVLDVACGEGYGSAMLAGSAARVVGVDVSAAAVRHARERYGQHANLEFVAASCDSMPLPDASFDLAVSFETIEHITTQREFIAELARVLRPDGVLVLSSPNKRLYSDAHDYHNEFHVRELYRDELDGLLGAAFPHRYWLGQKLMFHSAIWPESGEAAASEYILGDAGIISAQQCPSVEPMYYIVACSRNPVKLPAVLDKLSLFGDNAESVYRDYVRQTRRAMELDRLMVERERMIAERDSLLAQRTGQMEERERMIVERDAMLALRTAQMEERELIIAERDAMLALRTGQMEERERMIAERDGQITQRDGQIAQRDGQLAERDGQLAELGRELERRAGFAWWIASPWRFIRQSIKGKDRDSCRTV